MNRETLRDASTSRPISSGHRGARVGKAICCIVSAAVTAVNAQEKITLQDHVLPLSENNCGKCHNPDKKEADLDLTTYAGVMKGSGSVHVVVSGNPDGSKLWRTLPQLDEATG